MIVRDLSENFLITPPQFAPRRPRTEQRAAAAAPSPPPFPASPSPLAGPPPSSSAAAAVSLPFAFADRSGRAGRGRDWRRRQARPDGTGCSPATGRRRAAAAAPRSTRASCRSHVSVSLHSLPQTNWDSVYTFETNGFFLCHLVSAQLGAGLQGGCSARRDATRTATPGKSVSVLIVECVFLLCYALVLSCSEANLLGFRLACSGPYQLKFWYLALGTH